MTTREEQIRMIAYRLWEEDGRPQGKQEQHWLRAEQVWNQQAKAPTARAGVATAAAAGPGPASAAPTGAQPATARPRRAASAPESEKTPSPKKATRKSRTSR